MPTNELYRKTNGTIVIQIGNHFTNEGTYTNFSAALYLNGIAGNYLAKSTAPRTLTVDKCEGLGGIVSGTFSFTISNKTVLDERVIQDGKFRLIHTMTNSAITLH